jgi:FMN-dependent NADH-azoreductase
MTKMIQEHNATTGEIIEREINAEELAELKENVARVKAEEKAEAAKAAEKAALLAKLGISEDEARLLLG